MDDVQDRPASVAGGVYKTHQQIADRLVEIMREREAAVAAAGRTGKEEAATLRMACAEIGHIFGPHILRPATPSRYCLVCDERETPGPG